MMFIYFSYLYCMMEKCRIGRFSQCVHIFAKDIAKFSVMICEKRGNSVWRRQKF